MSVRCLVLVKLYGNYPRKLCVRIVSNSEVRVGSGSGQVAGTCEYGDEPSGSVKCGEFLD